MNMPLMKSKDLPLLKCQAEALPWVLDRDRAILGIGTGLGKTRVMLETFRYRKLMGDVKSMIIISPLRVAQLTWPDEVKKWAPEMKCSFMPREGWMWDDNVDIYVLNYEMVPRLMKMIKATKRCPANMVVLDECQCAKSPSAKRMQMLRPLLCKAGYVYGMTGTPSGNGYGDLYGQFKAIFQEKSPFPTLGQFERDYILKDPYKKWSQFFNPDRLHEFLHKIRPYMITQKASEFLDLPDIEYIDVRVPLGDELMERYKELEKELIAEIQGKEITAVSAGVLVGKLQQFTSGKIFYEDEVGEKRVVDVHDKKTVAVLKVAKIERPLLIIKNYTHTHVPGAEPFSEELVAKWNRREVPMMIGHPKSVGIGLNLQAGGSAICWYTPSYSLNDTMQTEARLYRTGQEEQVRVYRLICPGTVDEAVIEAVKAKERGQNVLMTALRYIKAQAKR